MVICFDFGSSNVVLLSNRNWYFYWFRCHHPLITQLSKDAVTIFAGGIGEAYEHERGLVLLGMPEQGTLGRLFAAVDISNSLKWPT